MYSDDKENILDFSILEKYLSYLSSNAKLFVIIPIAMNFLFLYFYLIFYDINRVFFGYNKTVFIILVLYPITFIMYYYYSFLKNIENVYKYRLYNSLGIKKENDNFIKDGFEHQLYKINKSYSIIKIILLADVLILIMVFMILYMLLG